MLTLPHQVCSPLPSRAPLCSMDLRQMARCPILAVPVCPQPCRHPSFSDWPASSSPLLCSSLPKWWRRFWSLEERQHAVFPLLSAKKRQVAGCVGGKQSRDPAGSSRCDWEHRKDCSGGLAGAGYGERGSKLILLPPRYSILFPAITCTALDTSVDTLPGN